MNGFKLHKDGAVTTSMKTKQIDKTNFNELLKEAIKELQEPKYQAIDNILSRLSSLEERLEEHIRMFHIKSPSPEPKQYGAVGSATWAATEPKQECGCHLPIGYHTIEDHNPIPTIQPKEDTKELEERIKKIINRAGKQNPEWGVHHCYYEDALLKILKLLK